jgi:Zn-dependent protease with chaperone function
MPRPVARAKIKGVIWLVAALLTGAAAAAGLPFFARQVPWSAEQRLATAPGSLPEIQPCDVARQKDAAALLDRVIKRVYPLYPADREFPLQITVIRGKTVNAFAFLGGQIFVYEGLLQETESAEELAGILAHEIEHVKRRHIIQGVFVRLLTVEAIRFILTGQGSMDPKLAGMLLNMHFSREQEHEADQGGLQRLHDARIDLAGFQRFFERAEKTPLVPTILSDHPAHADRAQLLAKYRRSDTVPIMSRAEWAIVKGICGQPVDPR